MKGGLLFSLSSLLMASLFALSASFQFNDPDWYFWIPLYVSSCIVNLINGLFLLSDIRRMGEFSVLLGFFMFGKVVIEDHHKGIAGFWSLNMKERVVREKLGSGLVITSMFLQLKTPKSMANYKNFPIHLNCGNL